MTFFVQVTVPVSFTVLVVVTVPVSVTVWVMETVKVTVSEVVTVTGMEPEIVKLGFLV